MLTHTKPQSTRATVGPVVRVDGVVMLVTVVVSGPSVVLVVGISGPPVVLVVGISGPPVVLVVGISGPPVVDDVVVVVVCKPVVDVLMSRVPPSWQIIRFLRLQGDVRKTYGLPLLIPPDKHVHCEFLVL